ncbi:mevalonate kinase [Daphnia magna]|uniref:mevalonate kinase n=1 Tax=Daphnia magna TaxID=35525 RepID=UPI001E1BA386|nr:mevalonate kinase [Daphnia magna]
MGETQEPTVRKFVVRTPGKLILTGEHAVVYGKLALAASVDLTTEMYLTLHTDRHGSSSFVVYLEDLKFDCSLPLADLQTSNAGNAPNLDLELLDKLKSLIATRVPADTNHTVQMSLLALCFLYCSIVGNSDASFEIRVKSTIPIGAGLGSSAAFSVGSSAVFHLLHYLLSSQGVFVPDLDVINSWAFQCEKMFHATPSGIDNAVCTYGGAVKYKKAVIGSISIPEARILLVNTGVGRQTKLLVEAVRQKRNDFTAIMDPILDSIDQISCKMAEIVQLPPDSSFSAIQELLSTNHWLLASMGVSHPSLDEIHRLARAHGQAGKLTGAGGGGLAYVWLNPNCSDDQVNALQHQLTLGNFTCWPTRLGVKGVHIEELNDD